MAESKTKKTKIPTNDEYKQLMREYKATTCQREKNRLETIILKGLDKLIFKLVMKRGHKFSEAMQEDCMQEARMCIIRQALPKYDEKKLGECKFSSYVSNWIMFSSGKNLDKNSSPVYIPLNARKAVLKKHYDGEEITNKERAYIPSFIYWDTEVQNQENGNSISRMDMMCEDEFIASYNEAPENIEKQQRINYAKKLLESIEDNRNREIVSLHLDGGTLQSISKSFGISRERCRQIFCKEVEKLTKRAKRFPMEVAV